MKKDNRNWPQTPGHLYRILVIEFSGSERANALLNLVCHQPDIGEIYLYSKHLY